jgi:hypothetical protein
VAALSCLLQVMYARQFERQAMKDALEMAVLTTVSHPNIIQVYNCFTDMVEDAGAQGHTGQHWAAAAAVVLRTTFTLVAAACSLGVWQQQPSSCRCASRLAWLFCTRHAVSS